MVITIVKNLTFVGADTQTWATDWVSFPAEYTNALLTVITKSRIGSSAVIVAVETTWDTDQVSSLGGVTTGAPAIQTDDLTGFGPLIRVRFTADVDSQVVLTVTVTPKVA